MPLGIGYWAELFGWVIDVLNAQDCIPNCCPRWVYRRLLYAQSCAACTHSRSWEYVRHRGLGRRAAGATPDSVLRSWLIFAALTSFRSLFENKLSTVVRYNAYPVS